MEHVPASDSRPVYHGLETEGDEVDGSESSFGHTASLITAADLRELTGVVPRMFALVEELAENDDHVTEVVTYGMALPGMATTISSDGRVMGRWSSAERAASRLDAYLVWLGERTAH